MESPTFAGASVIGRVALLNLCLCLASCGGSGAPAGNRAPAPVRVHISPVSASLVPGATRQFKVTVLHAGNAGVTWNIDGDSADAALGSVSSDGTYTAPDAVPTPDTVTIRATSRQDRSRTASAKIKILAVCQANGETTNSSRVAFAASPPVSDSTGLLAGQPSKSALAKERVIPANVDKFNCSSVAPGSLLTLATGNRGPLAIHDCNGTREDPIVIRNDPEGVGPAVFSRVSGPEDGFVFSCDNCTGVAIDGSYKWQGAPDGTTYGIKVTMTGGGAPSAFLKIGGLSRFVAIRNVEVDGAWPALATNGIGISVNDHAVKRADHPDLWREGILIEDTYVHDVEGEGMYIGPNYREGDLPLRDVEIRYNRVEDTGWDGINTKSMWAGDNSIHHNLIRRAGSNAATTNDAAQYSGIMNNAGTVQIYNNWIESTGQHGIHVWTQEGPPESAGEGPFEVRVWNNVIVSAGGLWQPFMLNSYGISIGAQPGCEKPIPYVYYNTIVSSRLNGINLSEYVGAGFVRDNLVADSGGDAAIIASHFIPQTNNRAGTIAQIGFQDPTRLDFHLGVTSPAWNQGSAEFPPTDFDDEARPRDGAPDPGAFEGTD